MALLTGTPLSVREVAAKELILWTSGAFRSRARAWGSQSIGSQPKGSGTPRREHALAYEDVEPARVRRDSLLTTVGKILTQCCSM